MLILVIARIRQLPEKWQSKGHTIIPVLLYYTTTRGHHNDTIIKSKNTHHEINSIYYLSSLLNSDEVALLPQGLLRLFTLHSIQQDYVKP